MIEIPLSSRKYPGLVALVDDADAELVAGYNWYPVKRERTFYVKAHIPGSGINSKKVYLHRLIRPDIACMVDHEDGNGLNNQRGNLRPATPGQQNANFKLRKDSTSGYKGVNWSRQAGKWRVRIHVGGKEKHIGFFTDPLEAAHAYDRAAHEAFGEYARLNFPNVA